MLEVNFKKTLDGSDGKLYLDIGFRVEKGELLCLYGKSGAGKTSILRMIAGLMQAEEGTVKLDGSIICENGKTLLPIQQRSIGFVFQDYALFPHLTVLENLRFAQKRESDEAFIQELLEITALDKLTEQRPTQLSGGQKQRLALARALAQKPRFLLLDEPLSALDDETRKILQNALVHYHKALGLTTILVSHDIPEIIRLADRVIGLKKGKIQFDESPITAFSKTKNRLEGRVFEIIQEEQKAIIKVFSNQNLLEIPCEKRKAKSLKKGDIVQLQIKDNHIGIL